jgi:predicted  nucleic acid-binding Zn-ribbon protein
MASELPSELPEPSEGFEWLESTKAAARLDITTQSLSKYIKYWNHLLSTPRDQLSSEELEHLKTARQVYKAKQRVYVELPKEVNPLEKVVADLSKELEQLRNEKEALNNQLVNAQTAIVKYRDTEKEIAALKQESDTLKQQSEAIKVESETLKVQFESFKNENIALRLSLETYKAMGFMDKVRLLFGKTI